MPTLHIIIKPLGTYTFTCWNDVETQRRTFIIVLKVAMYKKCLTMELGANAEFTAASLWDDVILCQVPTLATTSHSPFFSSSLTRFHGDDSHKGLPIRGHDRNTQPRTPTPPTTATYHTGRARERSPAFSKARVFAGRTALRLAAIWKCAHRPPGRATRSQPHAV